MKELRAKQGLSVLYRGLDSAIFRQLVYSSARLGSYNSAVSYWEGKNQRSTTKIEKSIFSILSGLIGALVGNPFDVALVRRQASINSGNIIYKNTLDAFQKIIK
jgi:solute carrier family 25 oxoglutarate transporter 11